MAENDFNLLPLLDYINPATVDYRTWVQVGMALKHEGYTAMDWDVWSQSDSRYKKANVSLNGIAFKVMGLGLSPVQLSHS